MTKKRKKSVLALKNISLLEQQKLLRIFDYKYDFTLITNSKILVLILKSLNS